MKTSFNKKNAIEFWNPCCVERLKKIKSQFKDKYVSKDMELVNG